MSSITFMWHQQERLSRQVEQNAYLLPSAAGDLTFR